MSHLPFRLLNKTSGVPMPALKTAIKTFLRNKPEQCSDGRLHSIYQRHSSPTEMNHATMKKKKEEEAWWCKEWAMHKHIPVELQPIAFCPEHPGLRES